MGAARRALRHVLFALALFWTGPVSAASGLDEALDAAFASGDLTGLHSVLVLHKGAVVAERYYAGDDENWGSPLGRVKHGPDTLHDLRSVTKSITSLLYGIALGEGLVPELDEPVFDSFPDYPDLAADPDRRKITVGHVLSMRMGTAWNEDLPYTDPRNDEIRMENAADRWRYVLGRPMVHPPGSQWTYNGGATALIGHLIETGTGMSVADYAEKMLFQPLGITAFQWHRGRDGAVSTASGLRLKIHDLARIGQMVLDVGAWQGRQVVPADWIRRSFAPVTHTTTELRYGLFWWLAEAGDPPYWGAGFGNGGQRLSISPYNDSVVVVFAGNYNRIDAWKIPAKIIVDHVLPALRARP